MFSDAIRYATDGGYGGYGHGSSISGGWGNVSPNDKHYAAKTYANLNRAQWADYKARFLPVQRTLIDSVTSRQMLDEQLSRIRINNNQSFATSAMAQQLDMGRYGTSQSPAQLAAQQRDSGMQSALSLAQANNATRQYTQDRNQAAMTGANPRPMIPRSLNG